MVIAIVGIFLLNRLHEVRWANQRRLVSTEKWRIPVAARKVACA
jgi:hypothetical protein